MGQPGQPGPRSAYRRLLRAAVSSQQPFWAKALIYFDLLVIDHGVLRPFYNRPTEIAPGVWRSNQPSPAMLKQLKRKQKIRTVLNLRHQSRSGYFVLEQQACNDLAIQLDTITMVSRAPPSRKKLHDLFEYFQQAERPLLVHCKSGADRAGMASALFLLMFDLATPEQAARQLSGWHLHSRQAQTGILDAVLAEFARYHHSTGQSFMRWVDEAYDPQALNQSFRPKGWAAWMIDHILRRE